MNYQPIILGVALLFASLGQASATTMLFHDRTAFLAQLASDSMAPLVEDFEDDLVGALANSNDGYFYDYEYFNGSGFSDGTAVRVVEDGNAAVSGIHYLGGDLSAGSQYWFEGDIDRLSLSFAPTRAFGLSINYSNAGNAVDGDLELLFAGASIALDAGVSADNAFFLGIIDDATWFNTAVITSVPAITGGFLWGLDDLTTAEDIPEPDFLWLAGLSGLALVARGSSGRGRTG